MPVGGLHRGEDLLYETEWDVLVKQVAHRIHKDDTRRLPSQWRIDKVGMKCNVEPIAIVVVAHGFEAMGHALGVAVQAPWTNL